LGLPELKIQRGGDHRERYRREFKKIRKSKTREKNPGQGERMKIGHRARIGGNSHRVGNDARVRETLSLRGGGEDVTRGPGKKEGF